MPAYCFVPGCRTTYDKKEPRKKFFHPPKDPNLFRQWMLKIRRKDQILKPCSWVCELHFQDHLIERDFVHFINGEEVRIPRGRVKLTSNAVPTIFPNLPKDLSSPKKKTRKRTAKKALLSDMSSCSVAFCTANSHKEKKNGKRTKFFRMPKDSNIRKLWIMKCYRKDRFNPETARICSNHFKPDDYEDVLQAKLLNIQPKKLKSTAVPSLNLYPTKIDGTNQCLGSNFTKKVERAKIIPELLYPSTSAGITELMEEDFVAVKEEEEGDLSSGMINDKDAMEETKIKTFEEDFFAAAAEEEEVDDLLSSSTVDIEENKQEIKIRTIEDLAGAKEEEEDDLLSSSMIKTEENEREMKIRTLEAEKLVLKEQNDRLFKRTHFLESNVSALQRRNKLLEREIANLKTKIKKDSLSFELKAKDLVCDCFSSVQTDIFLNKKKQLCG